MTLQPLPHNPIAVALDVETTKAAQKICQDLSGKVGVLKIGLELFGNEGPSAITKLKELGIPIFLDLKLHDIPNTVEKAAKAVAKLGIDFLTVHTTGGQTMLEAALHGAKTGADEANVHPPKILGVTVLTSLGEDDFGSIGWQESSQDQVVRLAKLAHKSGLRGLVCSGQELDVLKPQLPEMTYVVPGIRPNWAAAGDQKRVLTPADALAKGADYLVLGRPITQAEVPSTAAMQILEEINQGRAA